MNFYKTALSLTILTGTSFASIGIVSALRGDVKITRGIALYQAHKALKIEERDTFFTSKNGSMQITFSDNTVVTLGKNTTFKVDKYLYDEKHKNKNKAKFKFRKGFFKSITGRIGKLAPKNFSIKTKNSTIGVRGTEITGSSNNVIEDIVCTKGEIAVKSDSSDKIYVAVANEHVKIKLDPRVNYIVANPTDLLIQEQIAVGIKDKDDPELKNYVVEEISVVLKPEVKKKMIKQGIKIDESLPIVLKDEVQEVAIIDKKTEALINNNFLTKGAKGFKTQKELRKEIVEFTELTKDGKVHDATVDDEDLERERLRKEEEARLFQEAERKRVQRQQAYLEKKRNTYKARLPKKVPEEKIKPKKEIFNKKIEQMDGLLNNSESTF